METEKLEALCHENDLLFTINKEISMLKETFPKEIMSEAKKQTLKLESIDRSLQLLCNAQNDSKLEEEKEIKWKYAASVINKCFFWFSSIYFIITFSVFILSVKNFYLL